MKSEVKSISPVRKEAVVVVEKIAVDQEEEKAMKSFIHDLKIPGFRRGKVPASLIKTRYAKELQEQVDKTIATNLFNDLVKENQWDVFALAKFSTQTLENGDKEITFAIDLKPTFELIDYKNIEIDNPEVEVTGQEVDQAIEQIRSQYADFKEVKRPVQKGDFVRVQYSGKFEDGTPVADVVKGSPLLTEQKNTWEEAGNEEVPGVSAVVTGVIGMEVDQEKDCVMDFPTDFSVPELQGKKVTYHVKLFEVREKILPELNQEFFDKLKVENFEALRNNVTNNIKNRKIQALRFDQRESIVQTLLDQINFDIPETALSYEQVHIMRGFVERQLHEGMSPKVVEANQQKLYEDTKELSHDRAKINFVLEKIAELEKIELTDQEMGQMVFQEAAMLRTSPDHLIKELKGNQERILELRRRALFGKTLDFILIENLKRFEKSEPSGEGSQEDEKHQNSEEHVKGTDVSAVTEQASSKKKSKRGSKNKSSEERTDHEESNPVEEESSNGNTQESTSSENN